MRNPKFGIILFFVIISPLALGEMPDKLPTHIEGQVLLASIASKREVSMRYPELKLEDLELLDRYYVIDKRDFLNLKAAKEGVEIVFDAVGDSDGLAMCFEPRHYLSYMSTLGRVNVEICYQCKRMTANINGWRKDIPITNDNMNKLNDFFSDHGIKIPRSPSREKIFSKKSS